MEFKLPKLDIDMAALDRHAKNTLGAVQEAAGGFARITIKGAYSAADAISDSANQLLGREQENTLTEAEKKRIHHASAIIQENVAYGSQPAHIFHQLKVMEFTDTVSAVESYANTIAAAHASLAYSNEEKLAEILPTPHFNVQCFSDARTGLAGYVARDNNTGTVFVSFRGTESHDPNDIIAGVAGIKLYELPQDPNIRINNGYKDMLFSGAPSMYAEIGEMINDIRQPGDTVISTGHSMGGALAGIFSLADNTRPEEERLVDYTSLNCPAPIANVSLNEEIGNNVSLVAGEHDPLTRALDKILYPLSDYVAPVSDGKRQTLSNGTATLGAHEAPLEKLYDNISENMRDAKSQVAQTSHAGAEEQAARAVADLITPVVSCTTPQADVAALASPALCKADSLAVA